MNKETILKKLEENKDRLKKQKVKKIGLFGSYLKGSNKKNSDIDFLVNTGAISLSDYINILRLLETLFKKNIDLVIEEDLKPELEYIRQEVEYAKI